MSQVPTVTPQLLSFLAGAMATLIIGFITQIFSHLRHKDDVRLREEQLRIAAGATLLEKRMEAYESFYGLLQGSIEAGKFDSDGYDSIRSKFVYLDADDRTKLVEALAAIASRSSSGFSLEDKTIMQNARRDIVDRIMQLR